MKANFIHVDKKPVLKLYLFIIFESEGIFWSYFATAEMLINVPFIMIQQKL